MKSVLLSLLVVSGCATTGASLGSENPSVKGTARLELGIAEANTFPAALSPSLPSVDRIGHQVRAALGDRAVAAVDLCVSPKGNVTKVELASSSTNAAFDAALVKDAKTWRFAQLPGPASVQTCSRATISYLTYY